MIAEDEDSKARIEFGDWRDELVRRALADSLGPPLPDDFAHHTALIARARLELRLWGAAEIALVAVFVAALGLCIGGLRNLTGADGLLLLTSGANTVRSISLEPWLVAGIGCFVLIRVLIFQHRVRL
jgi:hypothetical protein